MAEGKYEALAAAGVRISRHLETIGKFLFEEMKKAGRI
jgi:succinyl-CoA synthetase alpha subunit